jgi:hypothetical protein
MGIVAAPQSMEQRISVSAARSRSVWLPQPAVCLVPKDVQSGLDPKIRRKEFTYRRCCRHPRENVHHISCMASCTLLKVFEERQNELFVEQARRCSPVFSFPSGRNF